MQKLFNEGLAVTPRLKEEKNQVARDTLEGMTELTASQLLLSQLYQFGPQNQRQHHKARENHVWSSLF